MSSSYYDNGQMPKGYMPKQGKIYIPGLGKYFKISPDEIFIDDLRDEIVDEVFNKVDDMIEDIVREKVEDISGLDDYLTKEEHEVIRQSILDVIEEVNNALKEATGENTEFLKKEQVNEMISQSLQGYYTKEQEDEFHANIVTEFTDDEILGIWNACFLRE